MRSGTHIDPQVKTSFLKQYGLQLLLLAAVSALLLFALLRPDPATDTAMSSESVIESAEVIEDVAAASDAAEVALVPTVEQSGEVVVSSAELEPQFFDLANVPIREEQALSPQLNPETFVGKQPDHGEFPTYVVERGDTPFSIALSYGIEPETILGGNPSLNDNAGVLQVEQELLILPIDGVLHDVQRGESLDGIANLYGVSKDDIIAYEPKNLEFPYRLFADTQILVPGAVREVFKWDPPTLSTTGSYWAGQSRPLVVGTGTFRWPVSGGRISQPYWYAHQALDVAILSGTPTYASDTGTVTFASFSPYCYGNLIVVNHGNGYETFYAHMSTINVVPGQIVYQGNLIGYTGNTGCSTGPHLHFEIRVNGNRDDPNWYLP